mmetsp:Transcript_56361/g.167680  ORF Transcript_56361/g.167680 Transcript_56361/m.167680 type:complete len:210 (-) Transcript_56361:230-859(-)
MKTLYVVPHGWSTVIMMFRKCFSPSASRVSAAIWAPAYSLPATANSLEASLTVRNRSMIWLAAHCLARLGAVDKPKPQLTPASTLHVQRIKHRPSGIFLIVNAICRMIPICFQSFNIETGEFTGIGWPSSHLGLMLAKSTPKATSSLRNRFKAGTSLSISRRALFNSSAAMSGLVVGASRLSALSPRRLRCARRAARIAAPTPLTCCAN